MKKIKILFLLLSIAAFSEEITIDKAVEMGIEISSDIKIKKLENESKKNSLKSIKSSYYPTLKATSSLSKSEESNSNYNSSIILNQSLFKGGEIKSSVEKAELHLKLSEEELNILKKNTRVEIINLYIASLKSQNQLKIYKNSLEELKKEYEKEKIKFDKNMSSKLDIMNIEISISGVEESIYLAEVDYKNLIEKLKKKIGYPLNKEITVVTTEIVKNDINIEDDIKKYLENSSYINKKKIEKEIYKTEIESVNSSYYPDINLNVSYNSEQNSFNDWDLKAGVGFEYTIYDFGKRKAEKSNAVIALKQYELESQNEISDKIIEIRAKYEEVKAYEKIVKSKKEKIVKMEEKFEITKIKYENRYIGSDDYLKDKNELQESRISALNSELEYLYKYSEYTNLLQ
jgi:outer membrane protein